MESTSTFHIIDGRTRYLFIKEFQIVKFEFSLLRYITNQSLKYVTELNRSWIP